MKQYQHKQRSIPALLRPANSKTDFRILNGMVEMQLNGERVVMPTAEAFQRLFRQVAVLEQRLAVTDNKATRAARNTK